MSFTSLACSVQCAANSDQCVQFEQCEQCEQCVQCVQLAVSSVPAVTSCSPWSWSSSGVSTGSWQSPSSAEVTSRVVQHLPNLGVLLHHLFAGFLSPPASEGCTQASAHEALSQHLGQQVRVALAPPRDIRVSVAQCTCCSMSRLLSRSCCIRCCISMKLALPAIPAKPPR